MASTSSSMPSSVSANRISFTAPSRASLLIDPSLSTVIGAERFF
jgi:hypothetical protein